jgi:hypothetical protein
MTDWLLILAALATLGCFGVIFILALAEYRATKAPRDCNCAPCPWPVDDEAEADGLLAEFHPFHSRGDKA